MKNTTGAVRTRLAGKTQFYLICFPECNELNTADRPRYNHRAAHIKFMTTVDGRCINCCDGSVFSLLFARNQNRDLLQPSDLLESRQSGAGFYKWCSDRREKRLRKQELGGICAFTVAFQSSNLCNCQFAADVGISYREIERLNEACLKGKHKRRKLENVERPIDHHQEIHSVSAQ